MFHLFPRPAWVQRPGHACPLRWHLKSWRIPSQKHTDSTGMCITRIRTMRWRQGMVKKMMMMIIIITTIITIVWHDQGQAKWSGQSDKWLRSPSPPNQPTQPSLSKQRQVFKPSHAIQLYPLCGYILQSFWWKSGAILCSNQPLWSKAIGWPNMFESKSCHRVTELTKLKRKNSWWRTCSSNLILPSVIFSLNIAWLFVAESCNLRHWPTARASSVSVNVPAGVWSKKTDIPEASNARKRTNLIVCYAFIICYIYQSTI